MAKMGLSLEEAPCGPTTSVGGSKGVFTFWFGLETDPVKRKPSRRLLILAAAGALAAAWIYGHLAYDASVERFLPGTLPHATRFRLVCLDAGEKLCLFEGNDDRGLLSGFVTVGEGRGYGGPMVVVIGWSKEGSLLTLRVPDHREDGPWFRSLESRGFFDQYIGKRDTDPLELFRDVDAVSGATLSSYGIAEGVLKARELVAKQLGHAIPPRMALPVKFGVAEVLLLLGFGWVVITRTLGLFAGMKWRRVPSLAFGFVVLGIWLGQPLSLVNFTTWLIGYPLPWQNNLFLYGLVLGTLVLALSLGKNFYCFWLCPFSAVQEGAHWLTGSKIRPGEACGKSLASVRYVLLWFALFVAFLFGTPALTIFEPWAALFTLKGTGAQWVLVAVTLMGAMFVHNFWCTYLCPVGALMDIVLKVRHRVTTLW